MNDEYKKKRTKKKIRPKRKRENRIPEEENKRRENILTHTHMQTLEQKYEEASFSIEQNENVEKFI